MSSIPLEFTCPNCRKHRIEEVQVEITVASDICLSQDEDGIGHSYGEQTNDGGHVARYRCKNCGWIIIDDSGEYEEYTQDGLDVEALISRIQDMNEPKEKADEVSQDELVQRFSDSLRQNGKYFERLWNAEFDDEVVYEGDGIFRWK